MSEHGCGGGCSSHNSGGCGGCGSHGAGGCGGGSGIPDSDNPLEVMITPQEEIFLQKLSQCPFLPVAQFLLRAKDPNEQGHMSLEPVFVETGDEDFSEIKRQAEVILILAQKNIVSVDFDAPLEGSDYSIFNNSFQTLSNAVADSQEEFYPPEMVCGSVCLTAVGDIVVEQLDFT
ncbi:MAG: hypothetical protein R3Y63_02705 [Eubacteriales bacterium]